MFAGIDCVTQARPLSWSPALEFTEINRYIILANKSKVESPGLWRIGHDPKSQHAVKRSAKIYTCTCLHPLTPKCLFMRKQRCNTQNNYIFYTKNSNNSPGVCSAEKCPSTCSCRLLESEHSIPHTGQLLCGELLELPADMGVCT